MSEGELKKRIGLWCDDAQEQLYEKGVNLIVVQTKLFKLVDEAKKDFNSWFEALPMRTIIVAFPIAYEKWKQQFKKECLEKWFGDLDD